MTNNSNTPSSIVWSKGLYSHWIGKALGLDGVKIHLNRDFLYYMIDFNNHLVIKKNFKKGGLMIC